MEGTRARYQHGSIRRENRKNGPAVWTLRWREYKPDSSFSRPKKIIGTVEQFPKKAEAWKACEHLRSTINREARTPTTVAELVTHYTEKELRKLGPSRPKFTWDTSANGCCPHGGRYHWQM